MVELDRRKRARLELFESLQAKADDVLSKSSKPSAAPHLRSTPKAFYCPLTMEVMYDPVLDTEGNTYERSALLRWLKHHGTSPISRQPLNETMVSSNNALRETIHELMGPEWVARQTNEHKSRELIRKSPKTDLSVARLRARMDCFLQNTSRELGGLDLKLNQDGCTAFCCDGITIVLDVPHNADVFCLYTREIIPEWLVPESGRNKILERALQLNFLQGETRGGCLSLRKSKDGSMGEIIFSYSDRISEVSSRDFSNILLNFAETSASLRDKLLVPPSCGSGPSPQQISPPNKTRLGSGCTAK